MTLLSSKSLLEWNFNPLSMTPPGPNIKRHSIVLGIKMDHKSLKLDLIYIIKKLVKEGKALTVNGVVFCKSIVKSLGSIETKLI